MKIGFIGLGLMGIPMAKNIISKGRELFVWNRSREKAYELENLGAKVCDTKKSLAQEVDILITMVTAGEDVEDILFGFDGVASSMKSGSIIIDMSTIGVDWAMKIGERLQKHGIYFLDAPVTGSTPKAITGELTVFIGGEKEVFEKIKPHLLLWGRISNIWDLQDPDRPGNSGTTHLLLFRGLVSEKGGNSLILWGSHLLARLKLSKPFP
ncbi:MAG: hypothetical protein HHAS10_07770 [Candidatus Altimarinota bacterium]